MSDERLAFGPFVLDSRAGTLLREGEPVSVSYRALMLLNALLTRPGEVLTKSELLDTAWEGAVVDETNLSVQIAALRKHLGETPEGGEWIATVPRVGYRFVGRIADRPALSAADTHPSAVGQADAGPSIAVLPFTNLSNDPEQDYFADGIVEEIIVALSRMRWLFVIAYNSSVTYKGRAIDVKQVGRELGVRYVLEGSIRKAGSRLRITGELVDTSTGAHLWADRFDGDLKDIFDLQDQVTTSVAAAIAPRLQEAEIERAKRKPTESLDAYDYYLRGMAAYHQWTKAANAEASALFLKAVELDPSFAAAYAMASRVYAQRKSMGALVEPGREIAECLRLARRAIELGRDDPVALCSAGSALAFGVGDLDLAATVIDRTLRLDPNMAWAWLSSSLVKTWLGEAESAIEHAARAMRLSPYDTQFFVMQIATSMAHFVAGRYAEAQSWGEQSGLTHPDYVPAVAMVAAGAALDGNAATAREAMERLRRLVPALHISNLRELLFPFRRPDDFDRMSEALRIAGLPE